MSVLFAYKTCRLPTWSGLPPSPLPAQGGFRLHPGNSREGCQPTPTVRTPTVRYVRPRLSLKRGLDNVHCDQPEGMLKPSLTGPTPGRLAQQVWGRAGECGLLTQP